MPISRPHAVVIVLCGMVLGACAEEGPAERAGEALDDVISEAQDRFEDVRDELEEAAEEVGDAIRGE